jgi:hypothetical protein
VDRINRRPGDEVHRGQAKRSARTSAPRSIKGSYTTTNGAYVSHFGSTTSICRSGENEGLAKDSSIETSTTKENKK